MLIQNMNPIQEAYFGKSSTLREAEGVIASIMKDLKIKNIDQLPNRIVDTPALNKSSKNKKLENLLQKQFGFGEVYFHWDGTDDPNAYSVTKGIIKTITSGLPKLPVKQADGGYYDNDHDFLCAINVNAGLIDAGLTAEEILGVILHEIGHNFDCTPVTTLVTFTDFLWIPINTYLAMTSFKKMLVNADTWKNIKTIADIKERWTAYTTTFLEFIKNTMDMCNAAFRAQNDAISCVIRDNFPEIMKEWLTSFDKMIETNKNKIKAQLTEAIRRQKEEAKKIEKNGDLLLYKPLIKIFTDIFIQSLSFNPFFFVEDVYNNNRGFSSEIFADSFATTYGYGPALASGFAKFSNSAFSNSIYLSKKNKYNVYNQYILVSMMLVNSVLDPHPMEQTRIKNQINKLRKELASEDLDPSLKANIEKDIVKIDKLYDEYLHMDPKFRYLAVIMNFRNFNETYFGGKMDFRDFVNRVMNVGQAES